MLYLVRHGIAAPPTPARADAERPLTDVGGRKLERIAAGLHRLHIAPDAVLSSPLRRARETAALLADGLGGGCVVEVYPPLAPGHAPAEVCQGLRLYRQARQLVLVGHEPDLSCLAAALLTGAPNGAALPFKKGAVLAVVVAGLPPREGGILKWFLTPKQLRLLGRGR